MNTHVGLNQMSVYRLCITAFNHMLQREYQKTRAHRRVDHENLQKSRYSFSKSTLLIFLVDI